MSEPVQRVHRETARDAGFGSISVISILAGIVTAYGAFTVVAALAGALANRFDVATDFRTNDWTSSGAAAAAITAGVLLIAYLFGGYVAGRMARRSGALHGLAVFVGSLILGAIAGGIVSGLTDNRDLMNNLRSIGVPTTTDQINGVAIAGIALSLAAVLLGSVIGGVLGERWHTRLARRAADPAYGPQADAWDRAAAAEYEAHQRRGNDPVIQQDAIADQRRLDLRDGATADEPRMTAAEWRSYEASRVADRGR